MSEEDPPKNKLGVRLEPRAIKTVVTVVLAFVVFGLANVVGARHFKRWDATTNGRYSLSAPTKETLHGLTEPITVWVLLGSSDPMFSSVKQLLAAYQAETSRIEAKYLDPDRDPLAFDDARRKFKIEAGKTEDGRVVADAVVVVARGDRHWYVTQSDLVHIDEEDERVRPREEQALTLAIRNVIAGDKVPVCFTRGHDEVALDDGTERGMTTLRDLLEKDNFLTKAVDTTAPNEIEPFKGCAAVVIAGLSAPFSKPEAERLKTYLLQGGNLLVAVSPIAADTANGMEPPGLEPALAPFGIAFDEAVVLEREPSRSLEGSGLGFIADVHPHAVTGGLAQESAKYVVPRVKVKFTRPLHKLPPESADGASPAPLLGTTPKAFGLRNVVGALTWQGPPDKKDTDLGGPLVLAFASERPKLSPSAPHGPRVVAVGSVSLLTNANFKEPLSDRGAALFVESSFSWLTSKPQIVDVPEKQAIAAGIRITDESKSEIKRYVLVYMPLAMILLGFAVLLRRRSREGTPHARGAQEPKAAPKKKKKKKKASE